MVKAFSKPQAAREIEARARAVRLSVRVAVVVEARHYCTASQSEPGVSYQLVRTPAGWLCSCLGYYHTGCCKHLGQLARRAERDGWDFGRIAPLAAAERYGPVEAPTPGTEPDPEPTLPGGGAAPVLAAEARRARKAAALADLYGDAA